MKDSLNIRNFCIISHIDHGKSTLADRFLELTGTVEKRKMREQFLDSMDLERERGITIKLQPVRMKYEVPPALREIFHSSFFILNLIDTPGHADFSYEVSRSLAACEGAILLVDATQGVQAQTLANLELARKQNLIIIPVINKIDLAYADIEGTKKEIREVLGCEEEEISEISAKKGIGIEKLLQAIVVKIPAPGSGGKEAARALIFDSFYDSFQGVVAFVRIFSGSFKKGERLCFIKGGTEAEIKEVGYFSPELTSEAELEEGEIGYISTGLKNPELSRVGDTITLVKSGNVQPLAGYKETKPVIFAGLYPTQGEEFSLLEESLKKLWLNDSAFSFEKEASKVLGRGFRLGCLGLLHLDIVSERLKREFQSEFIITTPSVSYEIYRKNHKEPVLITSAADIPDNWEISEIKEQWVEVSLICPQKFLGQIMALLREKRAIFKDLKHLSAEKVCQEAEMPLAELLANFYDQLKNITSGYGSFDYKLLDCRKGELTKMDILVAGESVSSLARVIFRPKAEREGRDILLRLKELLPRELFVITLQAKVGGRIVARENIKALKKDVTGYLYGGDYTRKMKLWQKQKKGKKKLKAQGRIQISPEVFLELMKEKH